MLHHIIKVLSLLPIPFGEGNVYDTHRLINRESFAKIINTFETNKDDPNLFVGYTYKQLNAINNVIDSSSPIAAKLHNEVSRREIDLIEMRACGVDISNY